MSYLISIWNRDPITRLSGVRQKATWSEYVFGKGSKPDIRVFDPYEHTDRTVSKVDSYTPIEGLPMSASYIRTSEEEQMRLLHSLGTVKKAVLVFNDSYKVNDDFAAFIDFIQKLIEINPSVEIDIIRTGFGSEHPFADKQSFITKVEEAAPGLSTVIGERIKDVFDVNS